MNFFGAARSAGPRFLVVRPALLLPSMLFHATFVWEVSLPCLPRPCQALEEEIEVQIESEGGSRTHFETQILLAGQLEQTILRTRSCCRKEPQARMPLEFSPRGTETGQGFSALPAGFPSLLSLPHPPHPRHDRRYVRQGGRPRFGPQPRCPRCARPQRPASCCLGRGRQRTSSPYVCIVFPHSLPPLLQAKVCYQPATSIAVGSGSSPSLST